MKQQDPPCIHHLVLKKETWPLFFKISMFPDHPKAQAFLLKIARCLKLFSNYSRLPKVNILETTFLSISSVTGMWAQLEGETGPLKDGQMCIHIWEPLARMQKGKFPLTVARQACPFTFLFKNAAGLGGREGARCCKGTLAMAFATTSPGSAHGRFPISGHWRTEPGGSHCAFKTPAGN